MGHIKRGVSLYSYKQEQFIKRMTITDMIREVHDYLQTDGIEMCCDVITNNCLKTPDYFYDLWNELMTEYHMKAVTLDTCMSALQLQDSAMNDQEMALPAAEEFGVRIGKEIRAPFNLRSDIPMYGKLKNPYMVEEIIDLADRKHTKYVGVIPDMSIFQTTLNQAKVDHMIRSGSDPKVLKVIVEAVHKGIKDPVIARDYVLSKIPDVSQDALKDADCVAMFSTVNPKEMEYIVPYIISIHGRFYQMTEIPGRAGEYEDRAVNYQDPIHYLKGGGFDGYICSRYEGRRTDYSVDEVTEVRRHHEMLQRLIEIA